VLRLAAALPLGSALNAATQAARGTLLTKMDDDDVYGPEHVWDLVLAQEYSQAALVGKAADFAYLAASDRTIRRFTGRDEQYRSTVLAGSTLLITRHMLDRVGGWTRSRKGEDQALVHAVKRTGSKIYRTHPYGFLMVRHGRQHTWDVPDAYFEQFTSDVDEAGWRPELAGVSEEQPPFSRNRTGRWVYLQLARRLGRPEVLQ